MAGNEVASNCPMPNYLWEQNRNKRTEKKKFICKELFHLSNGLFLVGNDDIFSHILFFQFLNEKANHNHGFKNWTENKPDLLLSLSINVMLPRLKW